MNYAIRNSIILAILLTILVSGFVIANSRLSKEKEILDVELADVTNALSNLKISNPDYNDLELLTDKYQKLYNHEQKYGKVIPIENTPTDSYLYLLDLIDKFCPGVDFDFRLRENKTNGLYSYNSYEINGISYINSIYELVSQIEKNRLLYTIENIEIMEELTYNPDNEDIVFDQVSFNLVINAYFSKDMVQTINNPTIRNIQVKKLGYNPFRTRIYAPQIDSEEEKYINIDFSNIVGLTPDRVFMRNESEQVVTLQVGDKVAYGKLSKIDWENQSVTFVINQTGIANTKTLYFDKE